MSKSRTKSARTTIGLAVLGAVIFTLVLLQTRPSRDLWDWIIIGMAAVSSLVFALGIFEYRSGRFDEYKQTRLLTALAGELRANLIVLRSKHRTPLYGRGGPEQRSHVNVGYAKLVRLPPLIVESAVSSGLFDPEVTLLCTYIARELLVHNTEVEFILALRSGEVHADTVRYAKDELDKRQKKIVALCAALLRDLESTGIKIPPEPPQDEPTGMDPG